MKIVSRISTRFWYPVDMVRKERGAAAKEVLALFCAVLAVHESSQWGRAVSVSTRISSTRKQKGE